MIIKPEIMSGLKYRAYLSPDHMYRWDLEYEISAVGITVSVIMVNPSTADGVIKDATIRKLDGFGARLGWSRYIVGNVHAFRATDVNALKTAVDPVGQLNSSALTLIMLRSKYTVVAWGSLDKLPPGLRDNWREVVRIARALNRPLYCWGTCNDGHPRHPVIIGYDSRLEEWKIPL